MASWKGVCGLVIVLILITGSVKGTDTEVYVPDIDTASILVHCTNELGEWCTDDVKEMVKVCDDYVCDETAWRDSFRNVSDDCTTCTMELSGVHFMLLQNLDYVQRLVTFCQEGVLTPSLCEDIADLAVTVRQSVYWTEESASGTVTETGEVIDPSGSQNIETEAAEGEWALSFSPLAAVDDPGIAPGNHLTITLPPIPDSGTITQPAQYAGTNPWFPSPVIVDEPPPGSSTQHSMLAGCMVSMGVFSGLVVATLATAGAAAPFAIAAGTAAVVTCAAAYPIVTDEGKFGASGSYVNCWGACGSGQTNWAGTILNVWNIISLDSTIDLANYVSQTVPYSNAAPYNGWSAQKTGYWQMDTDTRVASWEAHNYWMAQVSTAEAAITLHVPIVEEAVEDVDSLIYQGGNADLEVWGVPATSLLVLNCITPCGDSVILQISSPGSAVVTVDTAEAPVKLDFAGSPEEATIAILGLILEGFTLSGDFSGSGTRFT